MVGENYNSPQIFMTIIKVRGRVKFGGDGIGDQVYSHLTGWVAGSELLQV